MEVRLWRRMKPGEAWTDWIEAWWVTGKDLGKVT
jgi:hypothetical protein